MRSRAELSRKARPAWVLVWLAVLLVCYLAFLLLDFRQQYAASARVKYGSTGLCLLMTVTAYGTGGFSPAHAGRLLVAAMVFTFCADLFLLFPVLSDSIRNSALGVSFFCLAQLAHKKRFGKSIRPFIWALVPGIMLWPAALFGERLPMAGGLLLLYLATVYAVLLFTNTAAAFRLPWPRRSRMLAAMGMLLFVCCDLCVAGYQIALNLPALQAGFLASPRFVNLSWVFYLPSQCLLILSGMACAPESERD